MAGWLPGMRSEVKASRRREFEKLARDHYKAVFRAAYRLTCDREEAADLTQEALVKAYMSFHQFKPGSNFRAWVLRIVANTHISHYRRRQRRPETVPWEAVSDALGRETNLVADAGPGPETQVLAAFRDEEVYEALSHLPEEFRTVVILADLCELPYKEVAEALEVPIGTVRSRLFRARRMLRRSLADYARSRGYLGGEHNDR